MDFGKLAERYTGSTASQYDAERTDHRKWEQEQAVIQAIFEGFPLGLRILDIPVGTGRLMPFYKLVDGRVTGIDISKDMLELAGQSAASHGVNAELELGDIRSIGHADSSFDAVFCIRFLNWIDTESFKDAVRELARVSRKRVIVGVRNLMTLSDINVFSTDIYRWTRQKIGIADRHMQRSGLVFHRKSDVLEAFDRAALSIKNARMVERRSDGTDYTIYELEKNA